ncbi:MAG: VWA domain-containing protein [Bifidobacteriaceae bacterium]|nr:VWA domain-containing protein [Bifidobacteriaceae bacterium]
MLLGDSYTAGNGAGSYALENEKAQGKAYFRSACNWGQEYAKWLREQGVAATVTNVARGGDMTSSIYKDETFRSGFIIKKDVIRPSQINEAKAKLKTADLVMLTTGGNDPGVDFTSVVEYCFFPVLRGPVGCKERVDAARAGMGILDEDDNLKDPMGTDLGIGLWKALEEIENAVDPSRAELVLIGYAHIAKVDPDYVLQAYFTGEDYEAATEVRRVVEAATIQQEKLVDQWNQHPKHHMRVRYISSLPTLFAGHEQDSHADDRNAYRWANELTETRGEAGSDGVIQSTPSSEYHEWYHPNITGHHEIAMELAREIGIPNRAYQNTFAGSPVGVSFVVKTASSMEPQIADVREAIGEVVDKVDDQSQAPSFSLVEYGAEAEVALASTDSVAEAQSSVQNLTASDDGASPTPASAYEGIMTALDELPASADRKVVVVFGDEADSVGTAGGPTAQDVAAKALEVGGAEVYAVDTSGSGLQALAPLAAATGGQVINAAGADGVAALTEAIDSALAEPIASLDNPGVQQVGTTIAFDARGSMAEAGLLEKFEWDFDGDQIWDETTTEGLVTRQFNDAFDGVVAVRVTDSQGRTAVASARVLVTNDGDYTPPELDNCPNDYNWEQVDTDEDGLGDACDPTPGAAWLVAAEPDSAGASQADLAGSVGGAGAPAAQPQGSAGAASASQPVKAPALAVTGSRTAPVVPWVALGIFALGLAMLLSSRTSRAGTHRR